MSTYMFLFHFTEQGLKSIKDSPKRADTTVQIIEKMGGKMKALYWTAAKYDGVFMAELPDDEAASAVSLAVSARGFIVCSAVRAFNREEFTALVNKV